MSQNLNWFALAAIAIAIVPISGLVMRVAAQAETPAYQTDFPPEEFKARRARIYDQIGNTAVAVVQGVGMTPGFIVPRQNNEFYYLSGIETPGSYIMLDGRNRTAALYLPRRNTRLEASEGRVLSADDAELVKRLTGVDDVHPVETMRENWPPPDPAAPARGAGASRMVIYTPFAPAENYAMSRGEAASAARAQVADYWDQRPSEEMNFVHLLQTRLGAEVRDLTPILDQLRSLKSPREIDLIRRASEIAALGLIEAMKATEPGVYEYHLDAAARYVFLANGARLDGYRSITAAGMTNIVNIHYFRNTGELKDGDLVLMDYAPDFRYYTSDIGRMWPVNGTFNPEQRALLGFILEYRNAIISRIRPGVTSQQVMEEARVAMEPVFARWKFAKPEHEQAARDLVRTGGGVFSHPVGMAVHDAGGRPNPLRAGQVFSIDPQLRMRDANGQTVLYMRYEDVGVVTETGFENFTAFMPTTLEEIERTVRLKGIIQDYPPK
ncbi:MAG: aminopeptidase P N-terminal domain-containing protein [Acidobacteria bacterium]|nr:aminopeptidase P N-terminal domain-containing protein [Acidobacteriota bacterium]